MQHRLRVEETFKDFDRHRDGTITIPQFQQSLALTFGSNGLPLSEGRRAPHRLLQDDEERPNLRAVEALRRGRRLDLHDQGPREDAAREPDAAQADMPRLKAALTDEEEQQAGGILGRFRDYASRAAYW